MTNCKKCGTLLENDKYQYCWQCNQKIRQEKQNANSEIVDNLSKINNNLYYIRRALAIIIAKDYDLKITWDKDKKDFVEVNADEA